MKATQNSAPNSPRVSFCPACGAQVQQPDARFCNNCGTPLAPAKKLSVEEKKPPVSKPKNARRESAPVPGKRRCWPS